MKEDPELKALIDGLTQQLSYANQHTSVIAERLSTGVINNVLQVGTYTLDTSGQFNISWQTTCGCVEIYNHSAANLMTIVAGASGIASIGGAGTSRIPFGVRRVVNINAHGITVFGTAGDVFGLQAWTTGYKP